MNTQATLDKIANLCKRRGFVYPSSEIYGGQESTYDYGYYGILLKNNIRDFWWKRFVLDREDMIGIDSSIILHPTTWVASGHVGAFNEIVVDDKVSKLRFRVDHLIENWIEKNISKLPELKEYEPAGMTIEEMAEFLVKYKLKSPDGNEITEPRKLNQLFETKIGAVAANKSTVYLRGETAQGIFVAYKSILDSMRVKLPFGVGQVGKSFRNEITKGQFIFRTLEFEQMEIEYFFDPEASNWSELFADWQESFIQFYQDLGLSRDNLRFREHSDKERSHYSSQTFDIDYEFDFGFKEMIGLAYRADFDLTQHSKHSGKELTYTDPKTGRKFIPHVIEPAMGLNRAMMAMMYEGYTEQDLGEGKTRTVLKLKPFFAPIKVAVFPLQKDEKLKEAARKLFSELKTDFTCEFDDSGNIGKMYRRQDEIGTPFCVTVDFDTLTDGKVTIRKRDDMSQQRIPLSEVQSYIAKGIAL